MSRFAPADDHQAFYYYSQKGGWLEYGPFGGGNLADVLDSFRSGTGLEPKHGDRIYHDDTLYSLQSAGAPAIEASGDFARQMVRRMRRNEPVRESDFVFGASERRGGR